MSKWGHPVITLGLSPYNSVNLGHGNYPGSNGFIPGYGYYPGEIHGTYPWLDGPGTPFDRRQIAPQVVESAPPDTALIVVKVPQDAELWFDDTRTAQRGSYREFRTPALPADASYRLRVRWVVKGVELTRVESVRVAPGGALTVNFLTEDGWTGRRIEAGSGQ